MSAPGLERRDSIMQARAAAAAAAPTPIRGACEETTAGDAPENRHHERHRHDCGR